MLLGVVSDVHCNHVALDAALDEMAAAGVEEVLAAGDLVLEYRFSNEVVRTVRERGMSSVQGNHDAMLLGPHGERARAGAGVDPREVAFLATLPFRVETVVGGRRMLLTHGSPWEPYFEYLYPASKKFDDIESLGVDLVVLGHTHVPFVRTVGRTLLVNPGSIGQRTGAGAQLTYAVIDTDTGDAEIRAVLTDALGRSSP